MSKTIESKSEDKKTIIKKLKPFEKIIKLINKTKINLKLLFENNIELNDLEKIFKTYKSLSDIKEYDDDNKKDINKVNKILKIFLEICKKYFDPKNSSIFKLLIIFIYNMINISNLNDNLKNKMLGFFISKFDFLKDTQAQKVKEQNLKRDDEEDIKEDTPLQTSFGPVSGPSGYSIQQQPVVRNIQQEQLENENIIMDEINDLPFDKLISDLIDRENDIDYEEIKEEEEEFEDDDEEEEDEENDKKLLKEHLLNTNTVLNVVNYNKVKNILDKKNINYTEDNLMKIETKDSVFKDLSFDNNGNIIPLLKTDSIIIKDPERKDKDRKITGELFNSTLNELNKKGLKNIKINNNKIKEYVYTDEDNKVNIKYPSFKPSGNIFIPDDLYTDKILKIIGTSLPKNLIKKSIINFNKKNNSTINLNKTKMIKINNQIQQVKNLKNELNNISIKDNSIKIGNKNINLSNVVNRNNIKEKMRSNTKIQINKLNEIFKNLSIRKKIITRENKTINQSKKDIIKNLKAKNPIEVLNITLPSKYTNKNLIKYVKQNHNNNIFKQIHKITDSSSTGINKLNKLNNLKYNLKGIDDKHKHVIDYIYTQVKSNTNPNSIISSTLNEIKNKEQMKKILEKPLEIKSPEEEEEEKLEIEIPTFGEDITIKPLEIESPSTSPEPTPEPSPEPSPSTSPEPTPEPTEVIIKPLDNPKINEIEEKINKINLIKPNLSIIDQSVTNEQLKILKKQKQKEEKINKKKEILNHNTKLHKIIINKSLSNNGKLNKLNLLKTTHNLNSASESYLNNLKTYLKNNIKKSEIVSNKKSSYNKIKSDNNNIKKIFDDKDKSTTDKINELENNFQIVGNTSKAYKTLLINKLKVKQNQDKVKNKRLQIDNEFNKNKKIIDNILNEKISLNAKLDKINLHDFNLNMTNRFKEYKQLKIKSLEKQIEGYNNQIKNSIKNNNNKIYKKMIDISKNIKYDNEKKLLKLKRLKSKKTLSANNLEIYAGLKTTFKNKIKDHKLEKFRKKLKKINNNFINKKSNLDEQIINLNLLNNKYDNIYTKDDKDKLTKLKNTIQIRKDSEDKVKNKKLLMDEYNKLTYESNLKNINKLKQFMNRKGYQKLDNVVKVEHVDKLNTAVKKYNQEFRINEINKLKISNKNKMEKYKKVYKDLPSYELEKKMIALEKTIKEENKQEEEQKENERQSQIMDYIEYTNNNKMYLGDYDKKLKDLKKFQTKDLTNQHYKNKLSDYISIVQTKITSDNIKERNTKSSIELRKMNAIYNNKYNSLEEKLEKLKSIERYKTTTSLGKIEKARILEEKWNIENEINKRKIKLANNTSKNNKQLILNDYMRILNNPNYTFDTKQKELNKKHKLTLNKKDLGFVSNWIQNQLSILNNNKIKEEINDIISSNYSTQDGLKNELLKYKNKNKSYLSNKNKKIIDDKIKQEISNIDFTIQMKEASKDRDIKMKSNKPIQTKPVQKPIQTKPVQKTQPKPKPIQKSQPVQKTIVDDDADIEMQSNKPKHIVQQTKREAKILQREQLKNQQKIIDKLIPKLDETSSDISMIHKVKAPKVKAPKPPLQYKPSSNPRKFKKKSTTNPKPRFIKKTIPLELGPKPVKTGLQPLNLGTILKPGPKDIISVSKKPKKRILEDDIIVPSSKFKKHQEIKIPLPPQHKIKLNPSQQPKVIQSIKDEFVSKFQQQQQQPQQQQQQQPQQQPQQPQQPQQQTGSGKLKLKGDRWPGLYEHY